MNYGMQQFEGDSMNTKGKSILIADDDPKIRQSVKARLEQEGYDVIGAQDGEETLALIRKFEPCFLILDLNMPKVNGEEVCKTLRVTMKNDMPIIMLTAKTDENSRIAGLRMGADDYITKPFSIDLLAAKLQAVLRRAYSYYTDITTLSVGNVFLNLNDTSVTYEDKKLDLTKNEFKIMQILIENKNQVVSRDQLMKKLWDSDSFIDDNTLTVNVNRLRKKLEEAGLSDLINTKKGMGYMIHD